MAKSEIPQRIDPFLMSVLASRFEAIIREMTNTVMKAYQPQREIGQIFRWAGA